MPTMPTIAAMPIPTTLHPTPDASHARAYHRCTYAFANYAYFVAYQAHAYSNCDHPYACYMSSKLGTKN